MITSKPDVQVFKPTPKHPEINIYWDDDFSSLFQPNENYLFGSHQVPATKKPKSVRRYYAYRKKLPV